MATCNVFTFSVAGRTRVANTFPYLKEKDLKKMTNVKQLFVVPEDEQKLLQLTDRAVEKGVYDCEDRAYGPVMVCRWACELMEHLFRKDKIVLDDEKIFQKVVSENCCYLGETLMTVVEEMELPVRVFTGRGQKTIFAGLLRGFPAISAIPVGPQLAELMQKDSIYPTQPWCGGFVTIAFVGLRRGANGEEFFVGTPCFGKGFGDNGFIHVPTPLVPFYSYNFVLTNVLLDHQEKAKASLKEQEKSSEEKPNFDNSNYASVVTEFKNRIDQEVQEGFSKHQPYQPLVNPV